MKTKRILSMLLVLCLLLSLAPLVLAENTLSELTLPLTQEKQELTVWLVYNGTVVTDLNEIEGVKAMEALTNVHINWVPVSLNVVADQFGILLSSNDYPDIIYPAHQAYPGGFEKGIADGVIHEDIDQLIRQNMPNYMAYLNGNEVAKKQATSDNGKMSVVRVITGGDFTAEAEGTYSGLAYRKDLLDGLGLPEPKTVAQWHDALVTAKASGIEYPFMLDTNGGSALALSFGVVTTTPDYLHLEGDKVVSGVLEDGFGEYLDTMRQWYAEGLINPNFTSFHFFLDTPASVDKNEALLYSLILSAFTGNNYYRMHRVTNEAEFLQPIAAPAQHENDVPRQAGERIIAKDSIIISSSAKNPQLAAQWLDFLYSREGELLNWYGIEGVTYVLDENGEPQFTDFVLNSPDKTPPNAILQRYALNWGESWLGKHNTKASERVSTAAAGGHNQQLEAVAIWSAPELNVAPPTRSWSLTEDEGYEVNSKLTAIVTLINEYTINYIIGEDDTPFDEFRQQLIQFGYQDIINIYQTVYDRYLAR